MQLVMHCKFSGRNCFYTYFSFLVFLFFGIFCGISRYYWSTIFYHFTIFKHHLSFNPGFDLPGRRHLRFLLRHPFFYKKKEKDSDSPEVIPPAKEVKFCPVPCPTVCSAQAMFPTFSRGMSQSLGSRILESRF